VTRLRDIASLRGDMSGHVIPLACTEAADEIERLRAQVNTIANAQDGWGRVTRLKAEIERLLTELENVKAENQRLSQIVKY